MAIGTLYELLNVFPMHNPLISHFSHVLVCNRTRRPIDHSKTLDPNTFWWHYVVCQIPSTYTNILFNMPDHTETNS
jgi:hypothetical protein